MAKAGMKIPRQQETHETQSNRKLDVSKNDEEPVPENVVNAKHGHEKAYANPNNARPERNFYNKGAPHPKNKN